MMSNKRRKQVGAMPNPAFATPADRAWRALRVGMDPWAPRAAPAKCFWCGHNNHHATHPVVAPDEALLHRHDANEFPQFRQQHFRMVSAPVLLDAPAACVLMHGDGIAGSGTGRFALLFLAAQTCLRRVLPLASSKLALRFTCWGLFGCVSLFSAD
jgi:hypothetical protein